jgi:hypothetical protein
MIPAVDLPVTFDRIADFRFVRLLGSGSFAQTFEAVRGEERFAVKVLNELPVGVEARERFSREVASLTHRAPEPRRVRTERDRALRRATRRVHRDALPSWPLATRAPRRARDGAVARSHRDR